VDVLFRDLLSDPLDLRSLHEAPGDDPASLEPALGA
jgi:hypothetical protein